MALQLHKRRKFEPTDSVIPGFEPNQNPVKVMQYDFLCQFIKQIVMTSAKGWRYFTGTNDSNNNNLLLN